MLRGKTKLELVDFGYSMQWTNKKGRTILFQKGNYGLKVFVGHGKGNQLIQKRTKSQIKY